MADFTVHIPDSFVARVVVPVEIRMGTIAGEPFVVDKILPWLGVPDVASLTPKQQAEVICQYHLWSLTLNDEVSDATQDAAAAAQQLAIDDFNPGT